MSYVRNMKYVVSYSFFQAWLAPRDQAFFSCSIDTFVIQAFTLEKSNFKGKWEISQQEVVINLKEFIGRGGMRNCYRAENSNFPKEFDVPAPNGWVAKVHRTEEPGKTYDLCRKVSV